MRFWIKLQCRLDLGFLFMGLSEYQVRCLGAVWHGYWVAQLPSVNTYSTKEGARFLFIHF